MSTISRSSAKIATPQKQTANAAGSEATKKTEAQDAKISEGSQSNVQNAASDKFEGAGGSAQATRQGQVEAQESAAKDPAAALSGDFATDVGTAIGDFLKSNGLKGFTDGNKLRQLGQRILGAGEAEVARQSAAPSNKARVGDDSAELAVAERNHAAMPNIMAELKAKGINVDVRMENGEITKLDMGPVNDAATAEANHAKFNDIAAAFTKHGVPFRAEMENGEFTSVNGRNLSTSQQQSSPAAGNRGVSNDAADLAVAERNHAAMPNIMAELKAKGINVDVGMENGEITKLDMGPVNDAATAEANHAKFNDIAAAFTKHGVPFRAEMENGEFTSVNGRNLSTSQQQSSPAAGNRGVSNDAAELAAAEAKHANFMAQVEAQKGDSVVHLEMNNGELTGVQLNAEKLFGDGALGWNPTPEQTNMLEQALVELLR